MQVHLVDGTYELFRHHFAPRRNKDPRREVAATAACVGSMLDAARGGRHPRRRWPPTT